MPAAEYSPAPTVASIATGLISHHHQHLLGVPIVYVFRATARKCRGRIVLGSARLVAGLNAFLVALAAGEVDESVDPEDQDHAFFVMEIAEDEWEEASVEARRALVDHELCHFAVDEEDNKLWIRGHDVEEFVGVVERNGLWRSDVVTFAGVCATAA